MNYTRHLLICASLLAAVVLTAGCGGPSDVDSSTTGTGGGGGTSTAAALSVTANQATISPLGTTTITVHVVDSLGNNVPDGTSVKFAFTPGDQLKASLSSASATTVNGLANVTLTAGSTANTIAVVNASSGTATGSISISISSGGGATGTVTVSASLQSITVGNTTTITATVRDGAGALLNGAAVTFSLNDNTLATLSPTSATTNASGVATTVLTGTKAGTVNVTATVASLNNATNQISVTINPVSTVPTITVSTTNSSILTYGITTINVALSGFTPVDGLTVNFAVDNPAAATLSAASATTAGGGLATITLTAKGVVTPVKVTASYAPLSLSGFTTITISAPPPDSVTLSANPADITVYGTTTLSALVTGNSKSVPDGTLVSFILSDSTYGSLSTATGSTVGGIATTTFSAINKPGSVSITAVAGSVSSSPAVITIKPAVTGSIQFVSAVPQQVGLAGSGQTETSLVTFSVLDVNGMPVADGTKVDFLMLGPGGGAYIGSGTAPLNAASAATVNGNASVTLHSGTTAGPVTIIASTSVTGGTISSSASQISIGGGLPSATHFTLAASKFNLPGLAVADAQSTMTVYLADRFGNYNVLENTAVSFYAEAGAIDRQGITDATGKTGAIIFRTQNPMPKTVAIAPWEQSMLNYLNSTYSLVSSATSTVTVAVLAADTTVTVTSTASFPSAGWLKIGSEVLSYTGTTATTFTGCSRGLFGTTATGHNINTSVSRFQPLNIPTDGSAGHPRNGWVTVLATVQGEEAFDDINGNGIIESATESFVDLGEPFIDGNDDGCWNSGTQMNCNGTVSANTDPAEIFVDANVSGTYNPPNGVWDGPGCTQANCQSSRMIWKTTTLAFTGSAAYCELSDLSLGNIKWGNSKSLSFIVGDYNTNRLIPGTTIAVSTVGGGTLAGDTSVSIPDGVPFGPEEIYFTLTAPTCATAPCPAVGASLTVTVTPPNSVVGCTTTILGNYVN